MTPREIDALVAERIMGWVRLEFKGGAVFFMPPDVAEQMYIRQQSQECVSSGDEDNSPLYSSDITAAWRIVDQMRKNGYWLKLQSPFEADNTKWNAGFTEHSFTGWNGRPDNQRQADSAPMAICLAALRYAGHALESEGLSDSPEAA